MNTTMTLAALTVDFDFDRAPAVYEPGEPLSVRAAASDLLATAQGVELSVVWCTSGKGEEDLVVHEFRRLSVAELADEPLSLDTTLPLSPLSYAGHTVKVCWAVRARFFLPGGRQLVREAPFRLGRVQAIGSADADSKTDPSDLANRRNASSRQ